MTRTKEDTLLRYVVAFIVLIVAGLVPQAVCEYKREAFEKKKAAIMAKDIPPLEKCLQMLQLLEPK